MTVLDTNAILRFLLRDDVEKAVYVRNTMELETCLIPIEVIAEAVYVLVKTYSIERTLVRQKLLNFIWNENIEIPHQAVVETALHHFGETNFDFVDCLMIGYAHVEGHQVLTFDKKLKNALSLSTSET